MGRPIQQSYIAFNIEYSYESIPSNNELTSIPKLIFTNRDFGILPSNPDMSIKADIIIIG